MIYIYDRSFACFLSAVFEIYERKDKQAKITSDPSVFELWDEKLEVTTNVNNAERVLKAFLKKVNHRGAKEFYAAFLTESDEVANAMLGYMQYVFSNKTDVSKNYANPAVMRVTDEAKKVFRERHRMEAFVRFKRTTDNIYFATVAPDFNVLPLLISHFTNRYADQRWFIYDLKRKYGLYYNLIKTEMTELDFNKDSIISSQTFHSDEEFYQQLWKGYFQSVNIKSRVNRKLHLRHIPLRYWKYLVEKG